VTLGIHVYSYSQLVANSTMIHIPPRRVTWNITPLERFFSRYPPDPPPSLSIIGPARSPLDALDTAPRPFGDFSL